MYRWETSQSQSGGRVLGNDPDRVQLLVPEIRHVLVLLELEFGGLEIAEIPLGPHVPGHSDLGVEEDVDLAGCQDRGVHFHFFLVCTLLLLLLFLLRNRNMLFYDLHFVSVRNLVRQALMSHIHVLLIRDLF